MDSLIRNISACVQRVLVILVKNAITVRVKRLTDFFMRDKDTQEYPDPEWVKYCLYEISYFSAT